MKESDIIQIVKNALSRLKKASKRQYESHLIFPNKRCDNTLRISEQELRFAFVECFNEYCADNSDLYYAVEVPTTNPYRFSKVEPKIDDTGKSGNFDLAIYNKDKIVCLIEFKANNPQEKSFQKDLLKLGNVNEGVDDGRNAGDVLRFFIHLQDSYDNGTNIDTKLSESVKNINLQNIDSFNPKLICVILLFLNGKEEFSSYKWNGEKFVKFKE